MNFPIRWLIIIFSFALATFAQPMPSQSKGNHQDQAAVAHVEQQWLGALNDAKADIIANLVADDFVRPSPDSGQFVTKADLISYYRTHLKPIHPDQRRIEDMTVTVYGSTAIARGKVVRSAADGHLISTLLFTDVFVKRDGRWQAVSAQENQVAQPAPSH